jgi:hypothetical protein
VLGPVCGVSVEVVTADAEPEGSADRTTVAADAVFAASEPAAITIDVIALAGMSLLDRDGTSLFVLTNPPA